MRETHPDQPIFEPLVLPHGELQAEPVNPEIFLTEEHFKIPDPKQAKISPQPKIKEDDTLSKAWSSISHQSQDVYLLADVPEGHTESAHPKVAASHYKRKSSEATEVATSLVLVDVHSSQQEASVEVEEKPAKDEEKEDTDIEIL